MLKKATIIFLLSLVVLTFTPVASAHDDEPSIARVEEKNTLRVQASRSPKPREPLMEKTRDTLRAKVSAAVEARAHLKDVKVIAVGTNTLTVDNAGASVTVNLTDKTQLRRKFWGKSEIGEFSIGNTISVLGKWTNDTKTAINAVLVRNESIQKRHGTFFGTVKSLTSGGFVMTTLKREDQTVTIGTSKLINRREETIAASDIKVGDKVRVKGLWDASLKTVTEVKEVKNFSLPPLPSRSPKTNATPTASPTPTP